MNSKLFVKARATLNKPERTLMVMTVLTIALFSTAYSCVNAQSSIDQTIKIVVGFAPGGAADNVARSFAEQLRQDGNGSVIVENKPGASARIALDYVKQSWPFSSFYGISVNL